MSNTQPTINDLFSAGVHFGHQTNKWNPKMAKYIHSNSLGVHIIDLAKTESHLQAACKFLEEAAANGAQILFIGTKRQASEIVKSEAKRCESNFISNRWIGGMLTNVATIRSNIRKLNEYKTKFNSGNFESYTKKEKSIISKEIERLDSIYSGIETLNNPQIANPVFTGAPGTDSVVYTVRVITQAGCYAEDNVTVTIFNGISNIWVPSGFTPNKDGKNDILRPITKGIKQLIHFNVFNRWGQIIYTTNRMGEGWDGTYKGEFQPNGAYVYEAVGIDYADKKVYTKGTSVILR
jgi:ribosomal protein S2